MVAVLLQLQVLMIVASMVMLVMVCFINNNHKHVKDTYVVVIFLI